MILPLPAIPAAQQQAIDEGFARRLREAAEVQRALHQIEVDDLPMFAQVPDSELEDAQA